MSKRPEYEQGSAAREIMQEAACESTLCAPEGTRTVSQRDSACSMAVALMTRGEERRLEELAHGDEHAKRLAQHYER